MDPNDFQNLGLPKIPAQVIGYKLAEKILKLIENNKLVKDGWAGEMNVTYSYGGKLSDKKYRYKISKVKLSLDYLNT